MEDGWYLMSARDLEIELARHRDPNGEHPASNSARLDVDDALSFRNAGNLPDHLDRTLRLVINITDVNELDGLHARRLEFEPDYHHVPGWRRPGSRPVNVVPLRAPGVEGTPRAWWEEPEMASLEKTWQETGRVEGLVVPADYRSFVYKTVVSLRRADIPVTIETVTDSISRWLPGQSDEIRAALELSAAQTRTSRVPWPELSLVGIAAVWGLTFVMVKDAVAVIPVMTFLAYRFLWAAALVAIVFRKQLAQLSAAGWKAGILMGAFLTAGYVFQTFGLQRTSPASAGFITGLFVVLTPLFGALLFKRKAGVMAWMAAVASAAGLYLLAGTGGDVSLFGDLLVFGCACSFALHILATDKAAADHGVGALLAVQLGVCGVSSLVVAGIQGALEVPRGGTVWGALIVTAVFASAVGFFGQTYAQRHAPPERTALILASEPAFAGLFAWIITGQTLTGPGWLGAGLIMVAIVAVEAVPYLRRPARPLPEG